MKMNLVFTCKLVGAMKSFLVLYVDDIIIMGNYIPTLQGVKTWLGKCFSVMDLSEEQYILGIKIYRDRSKQLIGLSQGTYIEKVLKWFNTENSKRGFVPMAHGTILCSSQCPSTKAELDKMKDIPYASAVGSIMYAMNCTRPDIAYAMSMVETPDRVGRQAILNVHVYKKELPLGENVDLAKIASMTTILYALYDLLFDNKQGIEKKTTKLQGTEKAVVARHEAGHAVVGTAVSKLLAGQPRVDVKIFTMEWYREFRFQLSMTIDK
ncbi:hypothetical protein Lser_V15G22387 [Lactuca serriola]